MPTPVLMPALSPTMEEGTLAKWRVKEGDRVSSGDVIAEIETDKATMEVEAVDDGVVGRIVVPEGAEHVKVNAPIAILLAEGETAAELGEAPAKTNGGPAGATVSRVSPTPAVKSGDFRQGKSPAPAAPAGVLSAPDQEVAGAPGEPERGAVGAFSSSRIFASPLARRLAKSEGLNLAFLRGTGPRGRIIKRDIEAALTSGVGKAPPALAPEIGRATLDPRLYPPESYTAVKLDGVRKVIARRLTQSFNREVPHFPLTIDVELTNLLAAREALNALAPKEGEGAYKLSVNDFIVKASAAALMTVPHANASYTDEALILHRHADIAVAVATEGGLITPIVWRAETKGLKQISGEIRDLAARARTKKLKPEEYQGGTFTVSNLGMYGIKSFASIINQPHGAILSVGAGEERPVARSGKVEIATVMTATLTCDHRVVDGAVGAAFLAAFKRFVEEPSAMLL